MLVLSDFSWIWIWPTYFSNKSLQHKICLQFIQWEPSCSTQTDRQTNMMKVIFTFCNHFFSASEMNDSWNTGNRGGEWCHLLCDRHKRLVFTIDWSVAQPYSCAKITFLDVYFIRVNVWVEMSVDYCKFYFQCTMYFAK